MSAIIIFTPFFTILNSWEPRLKGLFDAINAFFTLLTISDKYEKIGRKDCEIAKFKNKFIRGCKQGAKCLNGSIFVRFYEILSYFRYFEFLLPMIKVCFYAINVFCPLFKILNKYEKIDREDCEIAR